MASLLKRKGVYYAQFHDQSRTPQRRRLSLRTKRKATARRLLAKLEDDWHLGRFDPWSDDPHAYDRRAIERVTLEEAQERFLKAKRQAGRSKETLRTYRGILRRFREHLGEETPLGRVRARQVRAFVEDGSLANSTRRKRYRHLKAFLRWCEQEGLTHLDATDGVEEPPPAEKLPKAVTREDLRCICEVAKEDYEEKLAEGKCREGEIIWYVPLFRFAFFTGLRASELGRLRWRDLDLKNGQLLRRGSLDRSVSARLRYLYRLS